MEGKMQYLYDEKGRKYLDAFSGIVTVSYGHCHPHVLEAITEQTKLLQHAKTIYLHHTIANVAEALAAKMPGNLKGVGNGLLLGAIVITPEMATVMAQKIQFNTFGTNPVCSAGGLAVLRVIDQEKHEDHYTTIGSHLLRRLRDLQQKHDSNFSLTSHSK